MEEREANVADRLASVVAREERLASLESTSAASESAAKRREETSRAAASAAAKAASTQANREREWARRVADERAELARLRGEAERLQIVAAAAETAATSAGTVRARGRGGSRTTGPRCGRRARRWSANSSEPRSRGPSSEPLGPSGPGGPNGDERGGGAAGRASKSRGAAVLSRGFVEKEAAMDERRKREREELEALGPRRMPNSARARDARVGAKGARLRAQGVGAARGRHPRGVARRHAPAAAPVGHAHTASAPPRLGAFDPPGLFGTRPRARRRGRRRP